MVLIVVGIVFFIIYGIPLIASNKINKGKTHQHKWSYCEFKSCPHLKKGTVTDYCELDKCIYDKEREE